MEKLFQYHINLMIFSLCSPKDRLPVNFTFARKVQQYQDSHTNEIYLLLMLR